MHLIISMNLIICNENGIRIIRGFVYERIGYERVYCTTKSIYFVA